MGGNGFWGTSKPYCSFCGWNLALTKERLRNQLKQVPWALLLFAAFFGAIAYFSKEEFALFPFLFLSVVLIASAITTWRQLRLLEASHPAMAFAKPLTSVTAAKQKAEQDREVAYQHLRELPRPRQARFKTVPRIVAIAFPISMVFAAYFVFQIFRDGLPPSSSLTELGPLLIFAGICSTIAVIIIRSARRDRKLLAEGVLAIATVTHQELSGGKHQRSRINYEFKDATGRRVESETTDHTCTLYEEMDTPVFYNPANSSENVPLVCASCELKQV